MFSNTIYVLKKHVEIRINGCVEVIVSLLPVLTVIWQLGKFYQGIKNSSMAEKPFTNFYNITK